MRYRFERKKTVTVIVIAAVMLILGGAYLWYAHNYGNAEHIVLTPSKVIEYEYKDSASTHGITADYVWSRTKELMVAGGEDGVLIPSSYMIEGRLSEEEAEESGEYLLSDQARLLCVYVRTSDRFKASALKNAVLERFDMENESVSERMIWLDAYLDYYVAFGNAEDYENIVSLKDTLFDETGMIVPDTLQIASYDQGGFVSVDGSDGHDDDTSASVILVPQSDSYTNELTTIQGVELSSVDLLLIKDLESNGLLPEGSYERELQIVLDGKVASDIPLYAYAYTVSEDGSISYIYSHEVVATVDMEETIEVMRHLAEVEELPDDSYSWIKNRIMNGSTISKYYYIVYGNADGDEAYDTLTDILAIAFLRDDIDLFDRVCTLIGSRVATYKDSPALSMIYRTKDDRFYFTARENLEVCLALM